MLIGDPRAGETPIEDFSGLKIKGIKTNSQLFAREMKSVRKPFVKYLASRPSKKMAPFDYAWVLRLHKEMYGEVWKWAGIPRTCDLNIGVVLPT